jgi:ubiquinone biosynthesis protein UbiJ
MLTEVLEKLLNRNLPRSPRARELAAELGGRRLRIAVENSPWEICLESTGARLALRAEPVTAGAAADERPADATLSGSPLALLALAGSDPEAVLRRGAVRLDGDLAVAQGFRELARLLRPDLEEELSRLIGDGPAHQALRLGRSVFDSGRRAIESGALNLAEYLGHESRDLAPATEAESLFRDVERLRDDVDRLAARIELLARGSGRTREDA